MAFRSLEQIFQHKPSICPARIIESSEMCVIAISIARYASRNSPKGIVPLDVEIGEAALLALSR
jgi:hypothetical protein